MDALTLLRGLAERRDYAALRDACHEADVGDAAVQVLLALADARLGNTSAARGALAAFDCATLPLDVRVDLAAVHIALDEPDAAMALLEAEWRHHPNHAAMLARLGTCAQQRGDRDAACAWYRRSLDARPSLPEYLELLRAYRDADRVAELATCMDGALRFWAVDQANWPDDQRRIHSLELRRLQLERWFAENRVEAAEAWLEQQHGVLGEDEWCALLSALAQHLAARDRHADAEEWVRVGLRRYPEQPALYDRLAELTHLQGRTQQAVALLTHAIRAANALGKPKHALLLRLSATALQSDPALARHAAERARNELATLPSDEVVEGQLRVEVALADVEAHEENYDSAEQRYRRILEQRPQMIAALDGLGQLHMKFGRIDPAVALFERVNAIDPARGHAALIGARRFPEDDDTLQRLERLARTPNVEGSLRASLLFQLAAAFERRADYAKAFALADEANAARRRLLGYDPKVHRQHCERIRHAFPKALYENRPGCGHESTLPVFVVGMPRSGTTLVEQIIAGHSRIHGAGELGVIPRVIAGMERWERHTGSGRRYPDCVDDLDPQVTRRIAENVVTELREYAPDAQHVVDKLPHNFENIGLIRLLFPNAKIVSVRRDPRDIAVSNYFLDYAAKHGGMGFAYDLDWIGEQLADHDLLMQHWQRVFPGAMLEVRYEDIVDDPERVARRMFEYIGVDWEPRVLDFHALARPVRTASVWQVRQPLYATSKARWKHYEDRLAPLLAAVQRRVVSDPIEMATLPAPGLLNLGVDCYRAGDLDGAEYRFKRLLRHVPEHAAARFMLGVVYVRKGYRGDGIALIEGAVERCPWNERWRTDLARAYRLDGRVADAAALDAAALDAAALDAAALTQARTEPRSRANVRSGDERPMNLDYLFLSGESSCTHSGSAAAGAPR